MRNLLDRTKRLIMLAAVLALAGLGADQARAQELPLGSTLPQADRALPRVEGGEASLGSLAGSRGTAILFWSNQCPWVDKYEARVLALVEAFQEQGINFVLVNANDPAAFPQEAAAEGAKKNYPTTYLMDPGSELARALGAERTPHVYLFDANDALVYVGAIDDSPGDPGNVQQNYLRDALDALVQGSAVAVPKTKAFGCMIKFRD